MVIAFGKYHLPSTISSSGVGTIATPFFRGEDRASDDWWGAQGHTVSESERSLTIALDCLSEAALHTRI